MNGTPALPAGQRGGKFSSPKPAARLFAATTHNGSTSCAASACTHGGNSALRARKVESPELISAVPKQRSHRFGAAKGVEGAMRGRVRLSAPLSPVGTAGAPAPAFF